MFDKLLIANRGEIAVRVIRACHELGVTAAVVYSDADADALHVRLADEAYRLPGHTATETYLNVDAVMEAVRTSRADAVHPGYGFLSESTLLSEALSKEGRAFVGPSTAVLDAMGSKITSRKLAEAAGVPGVPGNTAAVLDVSDIHDFANLHGYPVAIKASYGGGGRGIRVARSAQEAKELLESAQREALTYFGRSDVYLERYLDQPRHIEIQILADTFGSTIWIGDRDCSVQRRHQKLIEEAPASFLSASLRAEMGRAAVSIAQHVGYVNAGTVEFLVDKDQFYFLEMNTRLQVEHPVTEMVSGIDIVQEQLRIADGQALQFDQASVQSNGHAIEIRINAEDPAAGGFYPSPGTITSLRWPSGGNVRVDAGYESGDTVNEFYDGLVAKLIVHGRDRASAIEEAKRALRSTTVEGIATTTPAQLMILGEDAFSTNAHYTRWLEEQVTLPSSFDKGDRSIVSVGGREFWIPDHGDAPSGGVAATESNNAPPASFTARQTRSNAVQAGDGIVRSPMQGTVVKVHVAPGDIVSSSDVVCVVEAMKMENLVRAGVDGRIGAVNCVEGSTVSPGEPLVEIVSVHDE